MARKKRITKRVLFTTTVQVLQPFLHLEGWQFKIRFRKSLKNTIADCEAMPEYKCATIRVDHTHLKQLTNSVVVSTALHEMLHCIVWPMGELAVSLSKKDTTKLEICRQYEEGLVTHLELTFLPFAMAAVNEELRKKGYYQVELDNGPIQIVHDP